jgi:hypothetical protein
VANKGAELSSDNSYTNTSMRDAHHRRQLEHDYDKDKVCNHDCIWWIKEWYNYVYRWPYNNSPLRLTYDDLGAFVPKEGSPEKEQWKMSAGESDDATCKESVWFLAYPIFNYNPTETVTKHVTLPLGKWHFLVPLYNCHPSTQLYPSIKSANELFQMAKSDVDKAYHVQATLDGIHLTGCRISIDKPFTIKLPQGDLNTFGVPDKELGPENTMDIVSDGYWIWLKELPCGDHILELKNHSSVYHVDIKFYLYVRGSGT